MPSLQIEYKGEKYADMSFIDLKELEVAGDHTYHFKLMNVKDERGNHYDIEQITFKTNMSLDLYKIEHPDNLKMAKNGAVHLTIFTEELFNDKSKDIYDQNEQKHILQMEFNYKKVRTFR